MDDSREIIITFLHVVFGELAPKTFAIQEATRIALLVAPLMKFFYYVFVPGIIVFNGTANYFTRLAGVSPASDSEEIHSGEEIRMILTRSEETGHIDLDEVSMIESVFELGDTIAREVMVPRPDVETVLPRCHSRNFSQLPLRGLYALSRARGG
nr:CNNM domain-containing protein [Halegenticoccus soli]